MDHNGLYIMYCRLEKTGMMKAVIGWTNHEETHQPTATMLVNESSTKHQNDFTTGMVILSKSFGANAASVIK